MNVDSKNFLSNRFQKNDACFLKLFTDDTSFFSYKVKDCVYTWKMYFNPDPSHQAQEVIFSRICTNEDHTA